MQPEHIAFVILSFFAAYGARQMWFDCKAKGWIIDG
jgi:hypothetical protein